MRLSSLLKGTALEAYTRLSNTVEEDFDKVKQALLKSLNLHRRILDRNLGCINLNMEKCTTICIKVRKLFGKMD